MILLYLEFNKKVKLPSSNQQAMGHINANSRRIIPCIQRHKNTFKSNMIVAMLIAKNSGTVFEKLVDALNNH